MAKYLLIALPTLAISALLASGSHAQQRRHVSFNAPASGNKFTQQLAIEVGDIPGHEVRVYEVHRDVSDTAATIAGSRLVEAWTRGITDYTSGNGPGITYGVYVLENGDRFFTRNNLVAESAGPGASQATSVGSIAGGTGKLVGIQGVLRTYIRFNSKTGKNDGQIQIDYWMSPMASAPEANPPAQPR